LRLPSPLLRLDDDRLSRPGLSLSVKRDDLIHPELPGNKWRKLQHNLAAALAMRRHTLLTFGGAYSNHLRATAAAGHYLGLSTIGVVRGEEHLPLNPSLAHAAELGMQLTYLDRTAYREKTGPAVLGALRERWGEFYLLPEGGSNAEAVLGCAELPGEIDEPYDVICCPCGTGGTLAGIAAGLRPGRRALGFAVLRGASFLDAEVDRLQQQAYGSGSQNWSIEQDFHFGGYARTTPQLTAFADDFAARHGITLDLTYTAKMMYGIFALAERGVFPAGTRIIAVLTG
jgi:1-aminocyclopropane-1-carboxylate deaminase